ncbi:hypothetical protein GCM10020229_19680 [Kitasatospora albolonga]
MQTGTAPRARPPLHHPDPDALLEKFTAEHQTDGATADDQYFRFAAERRPDTGSSIPLAVLGHFTPPHHGSRGTHFRGAFSN